MARLSIGWIACKDIKILQQIKLMKDYLSICNSAPSEILSLVALKNKDKIVARDNQIVATNFDLLDEFFTKYSYLFT